MSQIKLYADEHIKKRIINSLKSKGFDIISTEEAGNKGKPDIGQLQFAASERRTFLTRDSDFFSIAQNFEHYGIIFITGIEADKEIIRKIVNILEMLDQEDVKGAIIYI